jgi:plastocyanin
VPLGEGGDIRKKPQPRSVAARMKRDCPARTLRALLEGRNTMSIKKTALFAAATALLAVSPAAAARTATITITHEMKGCHMWQLGSGKLKPNLTVTLKAGTTLRFVNNDIMPHMLIQQAGPKLTLAHPNMNRLSAVATTKFTRKGTYRFTTKPGEDYKMFVGHKTIGEDYVLHLTVHVK